MRHGVARPKEVVAALHKNRGYIYGNEHHSTSQANHLFLELIAVKILEYCGRPRLHSHGLCWKRRHWQVEAAIRFHKITPYNHCVPVLAYTDNTRWDKIQR